MISSALEPFSSTQANKTLVKQQTWQKYYYDRNSKLLPPLKLNDAVRYRHGSIWKLARVISDHTAPHSYVYHSDSRGNDS